MPVIVALNQKGGVGKSSTCYHLAGTLARAGRRVLLIDADPQASLTQGFWGPDATRAIDPDESVAALYAPHLAAVPGAVIRPTGVENLWIVPGSEALAHYNITPVAEWSRSERGMADFLAETRGAFDVTLVDAPPNLYLCSWSALVASDYLVVPVVPEDFSSQGLGPVQRMVAAVQAGANPRLHLLGFLVTLFDKRLAIHLAYETLLRQSFGEAVFTATFPLAKDFKEAVATRLPISHFKPRSTAAQAAKVVADELLARIEAHETAVAGRAVA